MKVWAENVGANYTWQNTVHNQTFILLGQPELIKFAIYEIYFHSVTAELKTQIKC